MPSTTQTLIAAIPLLSLTLAYGSPYSGGQNLYVRNPNPEADLYDSAIRLAARKASALPQQRRSNSNAPLRRNNASPLKTRNPKSNNNKKARSPKAQKVITRKVAARQPKAKAQPHAFLQYDSGLWARDGGLSSRDAFAYASASAYADPWAFADPEAFYEPDVELLARNAAMEKEAREAKRERRELMAKKRDASPLAEAEAVADAIADAEAEEERLAEPKRKGFFKTLFSRWW